MNKQYCKERNLNIDILKAFCAYMVIIIHCEFPFWSAYIDAFCRVAVLILFMIAGYFCKGDSGEIRRKVVKLLKIYIIGEVIYLLQSLYLQGDQWKLWVQKEISVMCDTIWNVFIYNNARIFIPGWFLLALAYAYLLYGVLVKLELKRSVYCLVPLLILWWWGWQRVAMLLRVNLNFLDLKILRAMPFFLLGNYFKEKETEIRKCITGKKVVFQLGIGTFLVFLERFMIEQLVFKPALSLYLGNVVVALGAFSWALYMPKFRWLKCFAYIGEKLSMYIYVIHMLIMAFLGNTENSTYTFRICAVSTIVAWVLFRLKIYR